MTDTAPSRLSLVELKNGKIIFKQKAIQLDKMSETLQEIVQFREMLSRVREPISCIPKEHHSLIGKLAHESDKTLYALSKYIRSQLLPEPLEVDTPSGSTVQSSESILPQASVEAALQSVARRVNYGIEQGWYGLTKPPSALCLWRWEIKDLTVLPSHIRDRAENRKSERAAVREEIRSILDAMSPEERAKLLGSKLTASSVDKTILIPSARSSSVPAALGETLVDGNMSDAATLTSGTLQAKPELQKTSARVQKQLQEEASAKKSAAAFARFFTKRQPIKTETLSASGSRNGPDETPTVPSDFDRTFHPFVLKKNVVMAPLNWFAKQKKDTVVIDSEDCHKNNTNNKSPKDLLAQNLRALPLGLSGLRVSKNKRVQKSLPSQTVMGLMKQLVDAEVCGDESRVLRLMKQLKDRRRIPVKTFTFAEDVRPGYAGTWTRSSFCVGPRTPFAKDTVVLDYSYDSGEEWEEEEEGEEVFSCSESDGDASDDDSLDGWLIDDEEDVGGEPINLDELDLTGYELPERKRKSSPKPEENRGKEKRCKLMQPLVPFAKGPCWETPTGLCEWDGFVPYRVQFFNKDSSGPIDPFTYVADVVNKTTQYRTYLNGQNVAGSVSLHIVNPAGTGGKDGEIQWKIPTQAVIAPVFPEEHIQALLHGIRNCKTANLNVLVDTLYQELKKQKVKKNSIERKVREIAEKRLDSDAGIKIWTVKMEYVQLGITTV